MSGGNLKSPPGVCKVVTLVIGVIILGVGLHSHFESTWMKKISFDTIPQPVVQLYKICNLRNNPIFSPSPDFKSKSCPSISLERYFISIIIICFILSALIFAAGFIIELDSHPLKWIDVGYHAISAVLLIVAGIVYLISASQIDSLFTEQAQTWLKLLEVNFRKSEKLAAGSLTIMQSLLYALVALLVARNP